MESFHKQKNLIKSKLNQYPIYLVHYLEASVGDLKLKVETTFISLKKTLISRICLVLRTTSDEKKTHYPKILSFWIDTWVSNDQVIFTTNRPCPCGAADTECGRWVGQSLFNCDQRAVHRKVFPEFAVEKAQPTHHHYSFFQLKRLVFRRCAPPVWHLLTVDCCSVEENASSKYKLRFWADSWTPFVKWNIKRSIMAESEVCSQAKFYYSMPDQA